MYFVNRKLLEERLAYIERLMGYMQEASFPSSPFEELASERAIHMLIETVLDVGNQIIDAFVMKDPGSYQDIILVLQGEEVIPNMDASQLIALISLRKPLVQEYTQVNMDDVWPIFQGAKIALRDFPQRIKTYLNIHKGELTAFDS